MVPKAAKEFIVMVQGEDKNQLSPMPSEVAIILDRSTNVWEDLQALLDMIMSRPPSTKDMNNMLTYMRRSISTDALTLESSTLSSLTHASNNS